MKYEKEELNRLSRLKYNENKDLLIDPYEERKKKKSRNPYKKKYRIEL